METNLVSDQQYN